MTTLPVQEPFVRTFNASTDTDAIHGICQQTLPPFLQVEPALSIAPYIWALPYVHLFPSYSFVLDSGTGTAVGYVLGTPSGKDFVTRYETAYIPTIPSDRFPKPNLVPPASWATDLPTGLLQLLYSPEDNLHSDFPQLLEEYPAHLHIDLLEPYQRKGYGRKFIEKFCNKLKEEGVKGVHVIMGGENRNEMFYQRLGFVRYPFVLDEGVSKEMGRHKYGTIWLVKSLKTDQIKDMMDSQRGRN